MKTTTQSAALEAVKTREILEFELGEQFGKETEEKLAPIKWSVDKSKIKNFAKADKIQNFTKRKVELIRVGGKTFARATLQPGWKWSESIKTMPATASCEVTHFQFHVSGILKVKMDSGEEYELKAGDISMLKAGHDAWVVGDEPVVVIDFRKMLDEEKQKNH